jgi:glycosyltransferase involved in cell wall biosynthesis
VVLPLNVSRTYRNAWRPTGTLLRMSVSNHDGWRSLLFVPSTSEASGVVTYVAALCEALPDFRCACVTERGSDLDAALPEWCLRVPAGPGRRDMTRALRPLRTRFSFVQTHGPRALLAARLARVPGRRLGHMFHEPGDQQGLRGNLEWRFARGIRLAANTPGTADWVEQRVGRAPDVLTPIVSRPSLLPREDARAGLGIPEDAELVVGYVGRLAAVKRPDLVVSAARHLGPRRPLVVFLGDGPERARLRELGQRLRVPVLLPGHQRSAASLLSAFDLLAAPVPEEAFGLAMAEAMAAEIPVAAVDSPGARMVTVNSKLAPLCPPTGADLGNQLAAALDESKDVLEWRAEQVLALFGIEAVSARAEAYFDEAIREDLPTSPAMRSGSGAPS